MYCRSFRAALPLLAGLLTLIGAAAQPAVASPAISLSVLGTYATGIFDDSAAEIVAHHAGSQRLFVVNGAESRLDVLDVSDPNAPGLIATIDVSAYGAAPNSVAVSGDLVAVAVEAEVKQDPGKLVFFDPFGNPQGAVDTGALPDMVTFTSDGYYALVANEGEPNDDYTIDPEGSITIVHLRPALRQPGEIDNRFACTADFKAFNGSSLPGVRVFGPGASVAEDLEPEYIAVDPNNRTAYVSLQENNALATVNIRGCRVTDVRSLGTKDHSLVANALDVSNRDDAINITTWPVKGMYQPDAIATYASGGETYIVSANEGDARDYDGFSEEERVKDLPLDPTAFPDAATLQLDENLGRLNATLADGDTDGDGDYDEIYSYGARSFSIWDASGNLVFDSGDQLEQITAAILPDDFNSSNDENDGFDNRSDDKGPEPEAVAIGEVGGQTHAFLGLERIGGIMVFDITDPTAPSFVQYLNNRDFAGDAEAGTAGDLGPEGIAFIAASESPTGYPLLAVANEVSGTTTLYQID